MTTRVAEGASGFRGSLRRARRARDEERTAAYELRFWEHVWPDVCRYVGLARRVETVTGTTIATPRATAYAGESPYLIVRLLPGQLPADIEEVPLRLAAALGVARLRVTARGSHAVRVD